MGEVCGDNRFELIEKYKAKLIEATNIETAKDEMAVIDSILFRFWQMEWLDRLEADVAPKSEVELLKRQLEPFKEKQCFTCKHYDIGHDHVPCYYCEDYDKYIWLSADADIDVYTSEDNIPLDVHEALKRKAKSEVAREIFEEIEKVSCTISESNPNGFLRVVCYQLSAEKFAELKKKYTEGKE